MSKKSSGGVRPLPFLLAVPLYAVLAVLAFSKPAAERLGDQGQRIAQASLGALLATHAGEAALISRRVRKRGYPDQAGKWARSTLLWGFPNHLRVGKLEPASAE
ncbi:TMEM254 family protein [Gordonia sp. (in: high G+C Gram-positive bacteria)]|uniref:TMEM254 family protein n=1 Tax=Gordonia sp. (in: high G+C Gram-positive bacteria) TaxID=84139 RepID=UPI0039E71334